jgi:hypothetical protein
VKTPGLLERLRKLLKPPPPPLDDSNFTPRAQLVIASAAKASPTPTAKDLAMALIAFNDGVQSVVLRRLKIDPQSLRAAIDAEPTSTPIDEVLKVAEEERRKLLHTYRGTEHLLLATLRCIPSVAQSLEKEGCNLEEIRAQIMRELDPNYQPGD